MYNINLYVPGLSETTPSTSVVSTSNSLLIIVECGSVKWKSIIWASVKGINHGIRINEVICVWLQVWWGEVWSDNIVSAAIHVMYWVCHYTNIAFIILVKPSRQRLDQSEKIKKYCWSLTQRTSTSLDPLLWRMNLWWSKTEFINETFSF